jgi:cytochrome c peroxidase
MTRRSSSKTKTTSAAIALALLGLAAAAAWRVMAVPAAAPPSAAQELAALGRQIFFDTGLSASGRQSCASCHDPAHAYGPPDGLATQRGGAALDRQGARAVPSLRYVLNRTPRWAKVYVASTAERLADGDEPPAGGFGWDGRFNSLHEQAAFPLLAPDEMANRSVQEVVDKLARAPYAARFRQLFGADIFTRPEQAFREAMLALERFELDDASLHPYTSRFDAYLAGRARLSEPELRGYALFKDPKAGNCASCHPAALGADGSHPLFTTFQFEALGAPRNRELAANRDPHYFDQGLCGPLRGDQADQPGYCGMFKTPGLRNVASRRVFLHNGSFHSLKELLRFYVQRDTDPARWYPHDGPKVEAFDDLPPAVRANVDHVDLPLTRSKGQQPLWNEAEIEDVLAFLRTLSDADVMNAPG